jgi:hypothetical protein
MPSPLPDHHATHLFFGGYLSLFVIMAYPEILCLSGSGLLSSVRFFIFSVAVTDFDTFPSVNCLYDESSFHWQLPRDSSAPLAITLKLFEFSGGYTQCVHHQWALYRFLSFSAQSKLFVFSVSYNQSIMASLASKPLPSRDHRR